MSVSMRITETNSNEQYKKGQLQRRTASLEGINIGVNIGIGISKNKAAPARA